MKESVGRKGIRMKTIQEVIGAKNELTMVINNLGSDRQYLDISTSNANLETLNQRLKLLDEIINNYIVYEWVLDGNPEIKRSHILDAS
tara:strand:+ start:5182 stop:5445 length:264 start_codon:yes stop_codon:yes gene_type:complete